MGQFSWLDCQTGEQVLDDVYRDVYVLVPKEFGGGHIKEECYDGYGRFGGYDIYDLVAEWNKDFVSSENLIKPVPENYDEVCWYESALKVYARRCECLVEFQNGNIDMAKKYGNNWKRDIGVYIACYDHQNAALPYPIKITHDPYAVYEECSWSPEDPNQGWR